MSELLVGLIGVCIVLYLSAAALKKDFPYLFYLFGFMFITMFLVLIHGISMYYTDVGSFDNVLNFVVSFEIIMINLYVFFVKFLSLLLTGRLFLWVYYSFVGKGKEVINP